ncbi:MAG: nuclear transport factor 2 family protein [Xanthomonadales bacterium]|nr:nuclear transport factor 2 family protein [Xanthomonadales bacterium]
MNHSNDAMAVADRFIAALNVCDEKAVRNIYSPDIKIWHNFDQKLQSIDDNMKSMHYIHSRLTGLNYDVISRMAIPGGFVQQHVMRGVLPSGDIFAMPACAICQVENNQITSIDEYLDTAQARALFK